MAIDDDPTFLALWRRVLNPSEFELETYTSPTQAAAALKTQAFDVVMLDLEMPEIDGLTFLPTVREMQPDVEAIVVSGTGTVATAVKALQLGAFDFLTKPLEDINVAKSRIRSACERRQLRQLNASLASRLAAFDPDTLLVGESASIRRVRDVIGRIADGKATVLISGESGTGKELAARMLQTAGSRSKKPFIAVNCAAISDTLMESELFGHERGAFTGAATAHRGLFEAADGGTLFLDEIGELPLHTQAKLLRVLQEGEVRAVGATKARSIDVRVVAATNIDLEKAIRAHIFREDLFYRINTFRLAMPALRDRLEDIPLLAHHLLTRIGQRIGRELHGFSDECIDLMMRYRWPGNVRQLNNAVEHGATLALSPRIEVSDLPAFVTAQRPAPAAAASPSNDGLDTLPYSEKRSRFLDEFDTKYLTNLMTSTNGNVSEASRRSGIDRANLRRMLERLDLNHLKQQA